MRTGAAGLRQRLGHGVRLRRHQIADRAAGQIVEPGARRELGANPRRPRPADGARTTRDQVLARPVHEELQLAVLVDAAETGDGRGALAVLAEALGPQLREPMREARRAGRRRASSPARGRRARAPGRRRRPRPRPARSRAGVGAAISASTTALAPARTARASSPRASAGSRPTLVSAEKRPPMPG